jgi:hypothetical protein
MSVYRRQQPAYVRAWLQATEIWARLSGTKR